MSDNTKTTPDKNYPSSDDIFDLDKIPMEILDKGYQSYRPYLKNPNSAKKDSADELLTAEEFGNYMSDD